MLKIKFSYPHPQWPIFRQSPASKGVWDDCEFHLNTVDNQKYDYWVIFGGLLDYEDANCAPENTLFLTAEASSVQPNKDNFLSQFAHIITCQRQLSHPSISYFHQGHPWFVGKNYDELIQPSFPVKSKEICVITSSKAFTEGHRKRLDFVMKLKEHYGDRMDLYGRGIRDFEDKWDVLKDYKYSIAIENFVCDDWLTEKLYDCFLSGTFPFYYGCPNVEKYFNKNSYEPIDINDLEKSIRTLDTILANDNFYKNAVPYLHESKIKYLNEYNIFPLVANFVKQKINTNAQIKQMTIRPEELYFPYNYRWIARRFKNKISKYIFGKEISLSGALKNG